MIYLIGSLRNPRIPVIGEAIRNIGHEVFDDWFAAGPEADDKWMEYEKARGHAFQQALEGHAANHVFNYDRKHLDRAGIGVLVAPCGRSGHLELGYLIGAGKPCFILLNEEPERFDVMYRFARVVLSLEELIYALRTMGSSGASASNSGRVGQNAQLRPEIWPGTGFYIAADEGK